MANLLRAGTKPGQGTAVADGKSSGKGKALLGSLFGAGKLNSVAVGNKGTGEGTSEGPGEGTGAVSKQYSAAHPILDALFNEGRAGALAEARNYQEDVAGREHQWQSERDAKQHNYSKELITDHLDASKKLAKYNSDLSTEGYSKQLDAKIAAAQKEYDQTRKQAIDNLVKSGHTPESAERQLGSVMDASQKADIAQKRGIISTAESDAAAKKAANEAAAAGSLNQKTRAGIEGEALSKNRDKFRQEFIDRSEAPGYANAASKAQTRLTDATTFNTLNPVERLQPGETAARLYSHLAGLSYNKLPITGADDKPLPGQGLPVLTPTLDMQNRAKNFLNPTSVLGTEQSSASGGTNTDNQPKTQIDRTAASPAPVKSVLSKVDDPVYQAPAATVMPKLQNITGESYNFNDPRGNGESFDVPEASAHPFNALMDSPFGQGILAPIGRNVVKPIGESMADTPIANIIGGNVEGLGSTFDNVDPLGSFKSTPAGAALSKIFSNPAQRTRTPSKYYLR